MKYPNQARDSSSYLGRIKFGVENGIVTKPNSKRSETILIAPGLENAEFSRARQDVVLGK